MKLSINPCNDVNNAWIPVWATIPEAAKACAELSVIVQKGAQADVNVQKPISQVQIFSNALGNVTITAANLRKYDLNTLAFCLFVYILYI